MRKLCFFLLAMLCLLSACGDAVPVVTEPEPVNETITVLTLGDNLLHMPVVNSGKQEDGSYDYTHLFQHLQPNIQASDLAVIGQETVFAGKEQGYSGYPLFNSPSDMGKTLAKEGFDVVLHASNHVLDRQAAGVENTLAFWDNYPDIRVLGINKSEEEKQAVEIAQVKGAKIALLNYTYGTNGISLPTGKNYLVNYIDEEKIMQDALYAEKNADFTIAFMHWGTEYSTKPDEVQKALALKMCEWGVDLIVGSHPHVIEPVEWIESENGNAMLVFYSLGNFVSRQKEARNLLGGVADVKLKFNGEEVFISDYSFIPIVTHYDRNSANFAVYPLKEYTDELASLHGINLYDGTASVNRWMKMVDNVFAGYDRSKVDLPIISE